MNRIPGHNLLNFASQIDDNTIEQAKETASMPFIHPHVALMPDAHSGKGSAVGTVIPTVGAVIPAAVGVDIGCVDRDTEYFTGTGWRKISEYNGGLVMQYDPSTGVATMTNPQRYIVKDAPLFYQIRSKYGVDQLLTPDHKMIVWEVSGRNRARKQRVLLASEFVQRDRALLQGYKAEFETAFSITGGVHSPPAMVRVHVMTSADASVVGHSAVLRLKKARKIERAQKLLSDAGIDYTLRPQGDGTTNIRYRYSDGKGLHKFWTADRETLSIIADEVFHWDGNLDDRVFYTRNEADADLVQYALSANGFRASKRADERMGAVDYRVFAIDRSKVGVAGSGRQPIAGVPSADGKAYCFTVPTGFLVLRRSGNIFVTGNCGMIAVRTAYVGAHIDGRDLSKLRASVESAIPLSPGNYNRSLDRFDFTAEKIADLERMAKYDVDLSHSPKWREQLGSLGGGNHFIELCVDNYERVWLFLHSGSRGVGNKIAQKHIKVAQDLCKRYWIDLPNRDLAYLAEGTDEFKSYIKELIWAQRFALYNRAEMMDRFLRAFAHWMGADPTNADEVASIEVERINCHHNYTARQKIGNVDVWLTRKGAIDANEGVMGVIPGSMGTRSYVVRGKGNPAGLYSAPHGAGRRFSRTKARELFTADDLAKAMVGIEYRHGEAWVDEIPQAYKDIDVVMDDAAELVEVVAELRQVMNVKGQ